MFGRKHEIELSNNRIKYLQHLLEYAQERISELTRENICLEKKRHVEITNEIIKLENHYGKVIHRQKIKYEKELKELKEKYNVRDFEVGEEVKYDDYIYEVVAIKDDYLVIKCISIHNKDVVKLIKNNDLSLGKLSDDILTLPPVV